MFQTDHTQGNGCGFSLNDVSFTLQSVNGGGDGCNTQRAWAWKHRQLMSNPKEDVADPVTRTDYKDPDMVGWYEE